MASMSQRKPPGAGRRIVKGKDNEKHFRISESRKI